MGNVDKIAPRMLLAGIEPIEKKIRQGAKRHIHSGQMADNVKHNKPMLGNKGWACNVSFRGVDKKTKQRNAMKAFVTEFGKKGQAPQPFVRPAMISAEKESLQAMQEVFEYETELSKIKV